MTQIGFYILPIIMLYSIFQLFSSAENKVKLQRDFIVFALVWTAYTLAMSFSGVLNDTSLPPRAPVFIIIPSFIIIFIVTGRKQFKQLIPKLSQPRLVYIQSFRIIVELLIYGAFVDGKFPQRVTFEGLNFDILMGIMAIPAGYLIQMGVMKRKGILAWNILGLTVLTLTGYAFISSFYFSDFTIISGEIALTQTPYVLLPAILLPIAIFYHVVSIRHSLMVK